MDDPGIEYVDFDEHYGLRADAVEGRARGLRSRRTSAAAQVNRRERTVVQADDPLLGFAPYVLKAPRRNSISPERQQRFIAALAASGIVTQAARVIGASLEALYRLRHQPSAEQFSKAWDAAIDRGMARLEDCALERALVGEERPVVRGGEIIGSWRYHDTRLLMFLLRQRRGERFQTDHARALKPGMAEYERLKSEWKAESYEEEEVILASINAKLDAMRKREAEALRLLDGPPEGGVPGAVEGD
jgi:hypothetical protein